LLCEPTLGEVERRGKRGMFMGFDLIEKKKRKVRKGKINYQKRKCKKHDRFKRQEGGVNKNKVRNFDQLFGGYGITYLKENGEQRGQTKEGLKIVVCKKRRNEIFLALKKRNKKL